MSHAKPGLLIVDDDPLITDTLHFVLSRDFEIFVAESRAQVKSTVGWAKRSAPIIPPHGPAALGPSYPYCR